MNIDKTWVVILAAGKGTRMGGDTPKVLKKIAGIPIIVRCLQTLKEAGVKNIVVVIGHKSGEVRRVVGSKFKVKFALQREQEGTAHSAGIGLNKVPKHIKTVLVLFGDDSGLYTPQTIREFIEFYKRSRTPGAFLTSFMDKPTSIGGIQIDRDGRVVGIMSMKDLVESGAEKYRVLCGAFCFDRDWLQKSLNRIKKNPSSGEYSLPAIYKIALEEGKYINTFVLRNRNEWASVNTPEELKEAEKNVI